MPQQRLFVSDSFAVLQDAFVTAVQALKTADPLAPLIVLAPEHLLALHLGRAVAWVGRGHVGLQIFTFLDFAREVAETMLMQEGQRPLLPLSAQRIVKQLLSEVEPGNYFAPLATQPGFPQTFLSTIADMKQAGIRPQQLRLFIDRAPQGGISRHKLESLFALYERYTHFLAEYGFCDSEDLLERAAALLESHPPASPLFLYGFYDFTPLQRRLIAAGHKERDILAFFPWRAGSAYEYATPALTWLRSLGLQYTPLAVTEGQENALTRVQRHLFEDRPPRLSAAALKSDRSLTLISAPTESREAREIARVILQLVRDHGLRFHEIGVLLRDAATYGPLLGATLTGLGIPCRLASGLPLIRTPAGQSLHLLCQVLTGNYTRSRVIEFLGVAEPSFATLLGELAEYARPAQWEAFPVEAGIVRGAEEWRERLARLVADRGQNHPDGAKAEDLCVLHAFVAFMQGFLTAGESLPRINTWRGWAEQTLRLLRAYVSPTVHTAEVEEALTRLEQLDPLDQPVPLEEWARIVDTALATTAGETGTGEGGVYIGDLLAARGVRFRAVIVPGLVEGSFPKTVRQDPVLLDSERQYLAEVLGCELPQRRRLSEEERLLFALVAQSAAERLVLTFPRLSHAGGHTLVPSAYLLQVIEALSGQVLSLAELEEWCVRVPLAPFSSGPPSRAIDAIEFHLASVERALLTGDPTSLGYLPATAPFFSCALHADHQRWDVSRLTAFDGLIEDESARAALHRHLFPGEVILSASALESYARCPFRYFLSAALGLTQQEDPEQLLTLHPRDRGALLHDILQDFFSRLRQTERLPVAAQDRTVLQALLRQVAEEHFQTFARSKATGFPLLWELEQERLGERLVLLLEREYKTASDFLPTAFEAYFGADAPGEAGAFFPPAPVRFALDAGEDIGLHGRVDRIDLVAGSGRARLLDYKTGKPVRGRFAGGTALQLPLYLFAARALRPDLEWVSAEYVAVGQTERGEVPLFTAETWPESLETLRQIVTALVQGMRSGCFFATPDSCYPCPFPLICGGQSEARAARKRSDPRLELLRQVKATL
ncbi:MAG TPA: PD-(D/E)XK nuclease family protein [Candidatus Binatia bacterium]|jgi:ATP-dependent helicase/DNAse subunit B|nr:PD-(D/E)XK nuclease family protein [Candidatus Binatia bacterium]